ENSKYAACCDRHRRQLELDLQNDRQRTLAAYQQVHQIRFRGVVVDRVAGRFLAHSQMHDRPTLVAGDDIAVHVAHEPIDGIDPLWRWLAASDYGAVAVAEHAVERIHPRPRRPIAKRVRAGSVRRYHSAQRAEAATRWIHRKTKPFSARRDVECRPQDSRSE